MSGSQGDHIDDIKNLTREELEHFAKEKEKIRQIVGRIGGNPTTESRIFNWAMIVLIIACLISAPFLPERWELPAVELGIGLISLKLFMFLRNEAKVTHFQFWMLSSLEWRLNDMGKRLAKIDECISRMSPQKDDDDD